MESYTYGQACHSGSSFKSTFAQDNYRLQDSTSKRNGNLKNWFQYINEICDRMGVKNKEIHKEARETFEQMFRMSHHKRQQAKKKQALCISSVYIACRHHDWPILITDVKGLTDASEFVLKHANQEIIKELGIEIETLSVEDYVATCLAKYDIKDEPLIKKTIQVIGLARDLWLTTGRKATPLVMAASCVVWQASAPANHKKALQTFESTVLKNQKMSCHAKLRYWELNAVLNVMVEKVPWMTPAMLKRKNPWLFFLDDILKSKRSLLSSLEPPKVEDGDDREAYIMPHPAFIASEKKRALEKDEVCDSENKVAKSGHSTRESMLSTELSEKDIPDNELHMYIKAPIEVALTEDLQQLVDLWGFIGHIGWNSQTWVKFSSLVDLRGLTSWPLRFYWTCWVEFLNI